MDGNLTFSAVIVIPARFGSTRLPGKPLVDICGKPMIQHVYERAKLVKGIEKVVVATDNARVADAVKAFGGEVVMTLESHPSGTDRLVEIMESVRADVYINIQGDEPLFRPLDIEMLVQTMIHDANVEVATLCHTIDYEEASNPNNVKVVLANNGDALYFSRSVVPFLRDKADAAEYRKHIGVYGYRRQVLAAYSTLDIPMIENAEKLEQLRLLAAGFRIRVLGVSQTGPGVDTPACLEKVRAILCN